MRFQKGTIAGLELARACKPNGILVPQSTLGDTFRCPSVAAGLRTKKARPSSETPLILVRPMKTNLIFLTIAISFLSACESETAHKMPQGAPNAAAKSAKGTHEVNKIARKRVMKPAPGGVHYGETFSKIHIETTGGRRVMIHDCGANCYDWRGQIWNCDNPSACHVWGPSSF
jgi:hypothetical protein